MSFGEVQGNRHHEVKSGTFDDADLVSSHWLRGPRFFRRFCLASTTPRTPSSAAKVEDYSNRHALHQGRQVAHLIGSQSQGGSSLSR